MLMSIRLVIAANGTAMAEGKPCEVRIALVAGNEITSAMKPDRVQNSARLAIISGLVRNNRANHLSWMVVARRPTSSAMVFGAMPVASIQGLGSPVTPRRNSAIAVVRIGGIQPSLLTRSP